jgi:hypothetical protein
MATSQPVATERSDAAAAPAPDGDGATRGRRDGDGREDDAVRTVPAPARG